MPRGSRWQAPVRRKLRAASCWCCSWCCCSCWLDLALHDVREAGDHDAAVALQGDGVRRIGSPRHTSDSEARVERPVCGVAHDGDLASCIVVHANEDLTVWL